MWDPGLDTWLWAYRARHWEEQSSSLRIAQTSRFLALEYAGFGSVPYIDHGQTTKTGSTPFETFSLMNSDILLHIQDLLFNTESAIINN